MIRPACQKIFAQVCGETQKNIENHFVGGATHTDRTSKTSKNQWFFNIFTEQYRDSLPNDLWSRKYTSPLNPKELVCHRLGRGWRDVRCAGQAWPFDGQVWPEMWPTGFRTDFWGNLARLAIHRTFIGRMVYTLIGHCHMYFLIFLVHGKMP